MTSKSKHKPVTLAKSATNFSDSEVHVADAHDIVHGRVEILAERAESKSSAKAAKATKVKTAEDHLAPAGDVIAVYRRLAERSLDQARGAFTKVRDEAEALSGKLEESSSALAGGTSAVQSYIVQAMQTQADDLFGYFRALTEVKTMSDAIELQSTQSRRSLDASLRQFKEISALMNDVVVKASTPIRSALPLSKN